VILSIGSLMSVFRGNSDAAGGLFHRRTSDAKSLGKRRPCRRNRVELSTAATKYRAGREGGWR
jgi:hypothetical protein